MSQLLATHVYEYSIYVSIYQVRVEPNRYSIPATCTNIRFLTRVRETN